MLVDQSKAVFPEVKQSAPLAYTQEENHQITLCVLSISQYQFFSLERRNLFLMSATYLNRWHPLVEQLSPSHDFLDTFFVLFLLIEHLKFNIFLWILSLSISKWKAKIFGKRNILKWHCFGKQNSKASYLKLNYMQTVPFF